MSAWSRSGSDSSNRDHWMSAWSHEYVSVISRVEGVTAVMLFSRYGGVCVARPNRK